MTQFFKLFNFGNFKESKIFTNYQFIIIQRLGTIITPLLWKAAGL